ncbi:hypothetical protein ElyMa_000201500 [Elysia marginata]|uniref:CCHC-type domain-containing protein n=1 Tax=Elysia marginata TaxID=1093978 RepID=A0AAV4EYI8_9GAST|nr:hypothetical protein ElyMa_000201500 [Elysia marginata]
MKTQATSYLDARPSKSFTKESATSFAGASVRPTVRPDSTLGGHCLSLIDPHLIDVPTLSLWADTGLIAIHRLVTDLLHMVYIHSVRVLKFKPFLTSKDNLHSASHQRNYTGAGPVKPPSDGSCYYCGQKGRYIRNCKSRQSDLSREAHVVC